jgi:hypothetical protein
MTSTNRNSTTESASIDQIAARGQWVIINYISTEIEKENLRRITNKNNTRIKKIFKFTNKLIQRLYLQKRPSLKSYSPIATPVDLLLSLKYFEAETSSLEKHVISICEMPQINEVDLLSCRNYIDLKYKATLRRSTISANSVLDFIVWPISVLTLFMILWPYFSVEISKGSTATMFAIIFSSTAAISNAIKLLFKPFIEDENSSSISAYEYWLDVLDISLIRVKSQSLVVLKTQEVLEMSFGSFTLDEVEQRFGLQLQSGNFLPILEPIVPSQSLEHFLFTTMPLARETGSEKARSEFIIAPILVELRTMMNNTISVFSGEDFSVDKELGLNGICDFLISRSPTQFKINAPVITLVEAKKGVLKDGWGQCIAEMVAASKFNEGRGQPIDRIYGVVTSGTAWQFFQMQGDVITIDSEEYGLSPVDRILSILKWMVVGDSS